MSRIEVSSDIPCKDKQISITVSPVLKASHLILIFLGSSKWGPLWQSPSIQSNLMLWSVSLYICCFIYQDDTRHNLGHSGGFICPFVSFLPIACVLINVYLLVHFVSATWTWVSICQCGWNLWSYHYEKMQGSLMKLKDKNERWKVLWRWCMIGSSK